MHNFMYQSVSIFPLYILLKNFSKSFEQKQVFMHNFLYQNVSIFALYILLTRGIGTCWSKSIDTFLSGSISTVFWNKTSYKKNRRNSQRFLNYTYFSCLIFYTKMSRYFHYTIAYKKI